MEPPLSLYFESEAEIGGGHLEVPAATNTLVYEIVARHHNATLEGGHVLDVTGMGRDFASG